MREAVGFVFFPRERNLLPRHWSAKRGRRATSGGWPWACVPSGESITDSRDHDDLTTSLRSPLHVTKHIRHNVGSENRSAVRQAA